MQGLFSSKISEIKLINPSSLDSGTIKRLEAIVESSKESSHKIGFYEKIGKKEKIAEYNRLRLDYIIEILDKNNTEEGDLDAETLSIYFKEAKTLGATKEQLEKIAKKEYELAKERGYYDYMIQMGEEIGLPKEEIKNIKILKLGYAMRELFEIIDSEDSERGLSYIPLIRKISTDLNDETLTKEIAAQSYGELLKSCDDMGRNFFAAGFLAKEYRLGEEKVLEAGKRFIDAHLKTNCSKDFELCEKVFDSLELPEEIFHPLALRLFDRQSWDFIEDESQGIIEKHKLTDWEINKSVNQNYSLMMNEGWYLHALNLRQKYPNFIKDEKVLLSDLETLVGVLRYYPGCEKE